MLNRFHTALVTGVTIAAMSGSAFTIEKNLDHSNTTGTPLSVPHLSPATFLSDYAGMEIIVHHANGSLERRVLGPADIPDLGLAPWPLAGVRTDFGAVGSNFTVIATDLICCPDRSGLVDLAVQVGPNADIHAVEFVASSANMVFDRATPNPGSAGSEGGMDAICTWRWQLMPHTDVQYVDEVGVAGAPPAGDTYARIIVDLKDKPTYPWASFLTVNIDTDYIGPHSKQDKRDWEEYTSLGDFNGDGVIDQMDLTRLLGAWGDTDPMFDLSGDGIVGAEDLLVLLNNWP